jgi:RNA polymerase sigma-70 factor (ECF subfamily)
VRFLFFSTTDAFSILAGSPSQEGILAYHPPTAQEGFLMVQTSLSLLDRLRDHPEDAEAWQRFDALYRPLLQTWLRGRQASDADDMVQNVLHTVVQKLPGFQYDPAKGKFRTWLRNILINHLRAFDRSQKALPWTGDDAVYGEILTQLEDPKSDLNRHWDREHEQHLAQRLLALIEPEFAPSTWQAFQRTTNGEKPEEVAVALQISVNAVYRAKSSVLKRLRQEMENSENKRIFLGRFGRFPTI